MSKSKQTVFDKKTPNLTGLELQKKTKEEVAQAIDWAEAIDSSNEGQSLAALEKDKKEAQAQEKALKDTALNYADDKRRWWASYAARIAEYGSHLLSKIDLPDGFEYVCIATDGNAISLYGRLFNTQQGVVIALKAANGNVYVRAMQTSMEVLFDINAIEILVTQAENTLDHLTGVLESGKSIDPLTGLKRRKSGILLT